MLDRSFNVLVVDDEPDLLAVSRLALKRVSVLGVPVRIHEAQSKREAIEFLTTHPEGSNVALALVDVVMESDTAGLELCAFVREELQNHVMPLVIRTGQAGKAPEREVIDRYAISGFVNKVEATDTRLYSLLKGGVRQYAMTAYDFYASQLLFHVVTHLQSAARLQKAVEDGLGAIARSRRGQPLESMHDSHCMLSTAFFAGSGDLDDPLRARALSDALARGEATKLSPTGDTAIVGDAHLRIAIEPTAEFPVPLESLWTLGAPPPPFVVRALYMATKQIQVLLGLVSR
ncbi:MAG: response regulator [Myxococcales bacterium]|nr:response regulator [Myxococcales bacterium]